MRVRGEVQSDEADAILGASGDVEFVPLLVPMTTYRVVLDHAKKEGCTAAEVFERALNSYMKAASRVPEPQEPVERLAPAITLKRRR